MALTVVNEPLVSDGNITDSNAVATRTQVIYDFNESDLGSKPGFRLEIEVRDAFGATVFQGGLFYTPKSDGDIRVDLGDVLFSVIDFPPATIFQRYRNVQVYYREIYTGFTGSFIGLSPLLAINGKLQLNAFTYIGAGGGANYINYLLYPNNPDQSIVSKRPQGRIAFEWQTWYSIILDTELPNRIPGATIDVTIDRLDANKNFISQKTTFPIVFSQANIRSGNIDYDSADLAAGAKYLEMRIEDQDVAPNELMGRYLFELVGDCENDINVIWYNSLGGKEAFTFTFNQEVEEVADVGEVFKPSSIDNIGTPNEYAAQTAIQRNVDNTSQRITCFADHLTDEDVRALHEIKFSEYVEVQVDKPQTAINAFVRVIVEDTYSTQYNTRDKLNTFSVKLRFPDNFDFFEAKNY